MDILVHATRTRKQLANSVAQLEIRCARAFERSAPPCEKLQHAIEVVWSQLITESQVTRVIPTAKSVASIYDRLVLESRISNSGEFTDRSDLPWFEFWMAGCGDESRCEDGWVIAELYWGGYVPQMQLTLAWLVMNVIRVQQKLPAILPDHDSIRRFIDYLEASGPELYDAESLRCLFYEYDTQAIDALRNS